MSDPDIDLSVVIGFRDWGLERLALSIESVVNGFDGMNGEVIVSDYGSSDSSAVERVASDAGADYLRVETDDVWSRSRALNAGLAVAKGKYLACTDADMLFTPGAMSSVVSRFDDDSRRFFVLQCRDLPASLDAEGVQREVERGLDWARIDSSSRLRPRWGMGGFIVLPREAFDSIRGLDERMEVYGGEDIDLANRLRRAGYRLEWLEDDAARMYHIWHPPTRNIASKTERGSEAILRNRNIMLEDKTAIRNIDSWTFKPKNVRPPVTVAIASYNRAETLMDSVHSVLAQSMSDFELIVMDDGSTDRTQKLLSSIQDDRLRVLYQTNQGVAAARNSIADVSRGEYTVVHDSDDLMPPWRLQAHLDGLSPQIHGNYGAAVNFDDQTGAMTVIRGKKFSGPALLFNSQVLLHGTMMVSTELLRRVRYDSTLRSGTDYNLNVRLAKLGVNLVHTGELHLLRRVHAGQMTEVDSGVQKLSSQLTNSVMRAQYGRSNERYHRSSRKDDLELPYTDEEYIDAGRPYLPDHLVRRRVIANSRSSDTAPSSVEVSGDWLTGRSLWSGTDRSSMLSGADISWSNLAALAKDFRIDRSEVLDASEPEEGFSSEVRILAPCIEFARQSLVEYADLIDEVYIAIFRASVSPRSCPDSLIAQATLTNNNQRYGCRIFSLRPVDEEPEAEYVLRMGKRSEDMPESNADGVLL